MLVAKFDPAVHSSDAEISNIAQLLGDFVNHARREFIEMQEYATTGAFYTVIKRRVPPCARARLTAAAARRRWAS